MDFSQTELLCDICKDGSLWMLKKKKSLVVSDTYWYAKFFFFKSEHGYQICLLKQSCHIALNGGYVALRLVWIR